MHRAFRLALFCGATPLLVGISIFLLWLVTHWEWLMMAGICTLYGGLAVFAVGVVALARFCWLAFQTPTIARRRVWLATLGCGGLLLSNFPAAGGIIFAVFAIETRYTVVVDNASQQPLDGVRVDGGGGDVWFGSIPPGSVAQRSFWIQNDGMLEFHATHGATTHAQVIDNYVTGNQGGHTTVTIHPNGTISVHQRTKL